MSFSPVDSLYYLQIPVRYAVAKCSNVTSETLLFYNILDYLFLDLVFKIHAAFTGNDASKKNQILSLDLKCRAVSFLGALLVTSMLRKNPMSVVIAICSSALPIVAGLVYFQADRYFSHEKSTPEPTNDPSGKLFLFQFVAIPAIYLIASYLESKRGTA